MPVQPKEIKRKNWKYHMPHGTEEEDNKNEKEEVEPSKKDEENPEWW